MTAKDYREGFEDGVKWASRSVNERGFVASPSPEDVPKQKKAPRKASAYSKRYGQMFRRVAPKYKLKSGAWAKDGFKRAQKAAHKLAKK